MMYIYIYIYKYVYTHTYIHNTWHSPKRPPFCEKRCYYSLKHAKSASRSVLDNSKTVPAEYFDIFRSHVKHTFDSHFSGFLFVMHYNTYTSPLDSPRPRPCVCADNQRLRSLSLSLCTYVYVYVYMCI